MDIISITQTAMDLKEGVWSSTDLTRIYRGILRSEKKKCILCLGFCVHKDLNNFLDLIYILTLYTSTIQ